MSETDSFIEEVTEEVRRDQLWGYARKYGWIAVVVVIGAVGATAWYEYRKAQDNSAAQALGDRVVSAAEEETPEAKALALAEVAATAGSAAVIVELNQAGALVESGDTDGALLIFDRIAALDDPIYADLAALKAVILRGDDLQPDERIAQLDPLATPGAPYRALAMEQKALALVESDDTDAAVELLNALLADSEATDALRSRVSQLIVALGGEIDATSRLLSEQ